MGIIHPPFITLTHNQLAVILNIEIRATNLIIYIDYILPILLLIRVFHCLNVGYLRALSILSRLFKVLMVFLSFK